jgi:hypothetical protein
MTNKHDFENLQNKIYELEVRLLDPEVRKSAEKIAELLAEDFLEHCSSGWIYHYSKNAVFLSADQPEELNWKIVDYTVRPLAGDVVLTTYKLIKPNESQEDMKYSLRSSIWKQFAGRWKLVFHQATVTGKIE